MVIWKELLKKDASPKLAEIYTVSNDGIYLLIMMNGSKNLSNLSNNGRYMKPLLFVIICPKGSGWAL
jgi:hypothetical protein